jgi:hypothetical protein
VNPVVNMRLGLTLFVLLFAAGNLAAQTEKPSRVTPTSIADFTVSSGTHLAKLILTTRNFVPSAHKIVRTKDCLTIDGRRPIGTDCTVPGAEIASMRLFFDGKEIFIPKRLYSDCYQPPRFGESREDWKNSYVALKLSDDLNAVFVFMAASDGAGVYDAIWILRKDGRHSRFTNSGGDCTFLNFDCRPDVN